MTVRYYSSVAPPTTLTNGINSGAATIQVGSTSGFPSLTPYTLSLSYDTIGEELVQVNSVGGTTLSVTRGIDGTSATSHNAGVEVRHVTSARDFADSRSHENADQGIHGLDPTDELVGADKAQTLANKTLDMAEGTLNRIDIFNGPSWITTVNGDITTPAIVFQIKPDPSSSAVFDFGSTGISRWRNVAAHDASNQYKFRITKSDGTTDVTYLTSQGQIRSALSDGIEGWTVQGSPDNVRRRALTVLDLNASTVRGALYTDGTASLTNKSPTQRILSMRMASGQTGNPLHIENSVGTEVANIDQSGAFNGRAISTSDNITTPSLVINGVPTDPVQSATALISFTSLTSFTLPVTFPTPFPGTPAVTTTINSLSGNTARWGSRAGNVTASGFTLFLFTMETGAPSQTWANVPVSWIASY